MSQPRTSFCPTGCSPLWCSFGRFMRKNYHLVATASTIHSRSRFCSSTRGGHLHQYSSFERCHAFDQRCFACPCTRTSHRSIQSTSQHFHRKWARCPRVSSRLSWRAPSETASCLAIFRGSLDHHACQASTSASRR